MRIAVDIDDNGTRRRARVQALYGQRIATEMIVIQHSAYVKGEQQRGACGMGWSAYNNIRTGDAKDFSAVLDRAIAIADLWDRDIGQRVGALTPEIELEQIATALSEPTE
jgi:hypothetical protein